MEFSDPDTLHLTAQRHFLEAEPPSLIPSCFVGGGSMLLSLEGLLLWVSSPLMCSYPSVLSNAATSWSHLSLVQPWNPRTHHTAPANFHQYSLYYHRIFPSLPLPIHVHSHCPMPVFTLLIWQLQCCSELPVSMLSLLPSGPPHPLHCDRVTSVALKSDESTTLPRTHQWLPFSCKMGPKSLSWHTRCSHCPPLPLYIPPLPISHVTSIHLWAAFEPETRFIKRKWV